MIWSYNDTIKYNNNNNFHNIMKYYCGYYDKKLKYFKICSEFEAISTFKKNYIAIKLEINEFIEFVMICCQLWYDCINDIHYFNKQLR